MRVLISLLFGFSACDGHNNIVDGGEDTTDTLTLGDLAEDTDANNGTNPPDDADPTTSSGSTTTPPEFTYYEDLDGDEWGTTARIWTTTVPPADLSLWADKDGDCDDTSAAIHPGATEIANGGVDDDCDPATGDPATGPVDSDGDGYDASVDCNDSNKQIYPGATEICNDLDDNCVAGIDEGLATVQYWPDTDLDAFGDMFAASVSDCAPVAGHVGNDGDCDDSDKLVNPLAVEDTTNNLDDNCNGQIDEGAVVDSDGDGYDDSVDCQPLNAAYNPGAFDDCGDGLDLNCDGIDGEVVNQMTLYPDNDGDGYADPNGSPPVAVYCGVWPGYADPALGDDCDDSDDTIYPGAAETCNGRDDDCDNTVDNGLSLTLYWPDQDLDGYGDEEAVGLLDCSQPPDMVDNSQDCDDSSDLVNPDADEDMTNGVDDDCDGDIDEFNSPCAANEKFIEFEATAVDAGEVWHGYIWNEGYIQNWDYTYWYDTDGDGVNDPLVIGVGLERVGACYTTPTGVITAKSVFHFGGLEFGDNGDPNTDWDDQMFRDCGQTPLLQEESVNEDDPDECSYGKVWVDGVEVTTFDPDAAIYEKMHTVL